MEGARRSSQITISAINRGRLPALSENVRRKTRLSREHDPHHRKGLTYLNNLAASREVQVEPVYKEAWQEVMALATTNDCLAMPEPVEALFVSPADVSLDDVEDLVDRSEKQKSLIELLFKAWRKYGIFPYIDLNE
jgi:hypothetical protein